MEITTDTTTQSGASPQVGGQPSKPVDPHRNIARLMILPGVTLLLLLVLFPVVMEIYVSLTTWTPTTGSQWFYAYRNWTWFANYWDGLTSPSFLASVARTIVITVAATGIEFVLGFGLALLFLEKFRGRQVATVLFLIPMMIVPAVSGFVFYLLLQTNGPVNTMLSAILPGTIEARWLTDPTLTPISVVIVDIWQWTPLMFLILLAGLMAVPEDQIQAADILGASWAQKLRHIVLPIVKPIILIALIIRGMEAFKIFDAAWLLTRGGPGEASSTISVKLYREAFQNSQWSYVAALAIVVMIFVSVVASQAIKPLERARRGRHEGSTDVGAGPPDRVRPRGVPVPRLLDCDDGVQARRRVDADEREDLLGAGQSDARQLPAHLRRHPGGIRQLPRLDPDQRYRSDHHEPHHGDRRDAARALRRRLRGLRDLPLPVPAARCSAFSILQLRMFPPIAIIIPVLFLWTYLQLFDTRLGLILIYGAVTFPFVVWLMKSFFDEVPREISEAAIVDGCSQFGAFRKAVLPLVKGGLATTALFVFILNWSDFLIALVLSGNNVVTAPVFLSQITSAATGQEFGSRAALGVILITPPMVLSILIQKHLVRGLTFGAVKR